MRILSTQEVLPADASEATLVGRAFVPGYQGPSVVTIRGDEVIDVSRSFATVRDLCESERPSRAVAAASGERLGTVDELLRNTPRQNRDSKLPWLLAPIDLQAVKAAGVTFAASLLERFIEEQARGEPSRAAEIRRDLDKQLGIDLAAIRPGTAEAARVKSVLVERGQWSQYLEVGLGPDAEIFTKAQPMSSVGAGSQVGILSTSKWSNPEPEIVLVVSSAGRVIGATLGNDVNLRDVEGRSALLLGRAKDNNASSAIGPFIRLFDDRFGIEAVRAVVVSLVVEGADGFRLSGESSMAKISRDPLDIVGQAIGPHHQYPDGFVLFLGTMFAPTEDRGEKGMGFTHHPGDVVIVQTPKLGALWNEVVHCEQAEPWTFGTADLFQNLARRGLLQS
jgi:fumarylacetoacetate (FAA) hydrolase family protein